MRTFKQKSSDLTYSTSGLRPASTSVTRAPKPSAQPGPKWRPTRHHSQHQYSHYASSPHLFVFQGVDDDDVNSDDTNPKHDEFRTTVVGIPNSYTDYQIYSSTNDVQRRSSAAVKRITEHYDSVRRLADRTASLDLVDAVGDDDDVPGVVEDGELMLSERDVTRIEAFFRALKTSVFVCRSLANLYVGGIDSRVSNRGWGERKFTGVPLLVLDTGKTRSRDKRQLQIVLAERESGFTLWREVIDNLTDYRASTDSFHTMYASKNHKVMFGLSFDSSAAASDFLRQIETLTSNPVNISLSAPKGKAAKAQSAKALSAKYKPPRKCDISSPCFFEHITNLGTGDTQLYTVQAYVSGGSSSSSTVEGSDV